MTAEKAAGIIELDPFNIEEVEILANADKPEGEVSIELDMSASLWFDVLDTYLRNKAHVPVEMRN